MIDETVLDHETEPATAEKDRPAPAIKKRRDWVRCGVACAQCGKDQWWFFQGFNRCDCGQAIWVARVKDEKGNTRFPYLQGRELPADHPGHMGVTQ